MMADDKPWTKDGRGLAEMTDAELTELMWWGDMLSVEDSHALCAEFDRRGLNLDDTSG